MLYEALFYGSLGSFVERRKGGRVFIGNLREGSK
jgi:hypothetical protein